jgi:hypothetical protein
MPGHVYETKADLVALRRWYLEVSEANVDGDSAALLFFQAVGIDAGEGLDQRGLAVVNVSGGADYDTFHLFLSLRSKTALRSFLYPKLFCLASGRSASTGLAAFTSCISVAPLQNRLSS